MPTIEKYEKALSLYSDIFNTVPQKQKHKYLHPIKTAGIEYKKALKLGFRATEYMWTNCSKRADRKNGKLYLIGYGIIVFTYISDNYLTIIKFKFMVVKMVLLKISR